MKINWFSPLPPARTDIAHYTTRVLPALCALADVTLWTDQREWDQALKKQVAVRTFRLGRMPWVELNRADANLYQIGNNPQFHSSIWQISRLHAGIVVLHDFRLHHFFDDIFRVKWRDLDSYCAVMENYYGLEARRDAIESFNSNARNITYMAERYPLTDLAVKNQLGVIVHTQETFDALTKEALSPVMLAPLPFAAGPASSHVQNRADKQSGPPYRLIIFGYIGRSRRLSSVLKALAALPEPGKFHLDVYGDILDGEEELRNQIRTLDLKERVTIHGFATEAKLDEALSRAHLAINLRYPTMGEASGSQLRIWKHGLPALVSNVGWYAALPSNAVAFVRTDDHEEADLQAHLHAFIADPQFFVDMGRRGRQELERKHAPERYASSLVEMARLGEEFRARVAANRLAERSGTLLSEWLGLTAIGEAGANVAKEIFEMGIRIQKR